MYVSIDVKVNVCMYVCMCGWECERNASQNEKTLRIFSPSSSSSLQSLSSNIWNKSVDRKKKKKKKRVEKGDGW